MKSMTLCTRRLSSKIAIRSIFGLVYVFHIHESFLLICSQANVMLSYKIPAAIALLHSKLEAAEMSMRNTVEDLEFLREQITMMEVNTARVYNWDVKRRREKRERPIGNSD